jgi:hypothetical protein
MAEQLLEYPYGGTVSSAGENPCGTGVVFEIIEEIFKKIYQEGERTFGKIVYDARCRIIQRYFPYEPNYGPAVLYTTLGDPALRIKLPPMQVIDEQVNIIKKNEYIGPTIISGPLHLPAGKKVRIFDVSGRIIKSNEMNKGIYFIEIEGNQIQKIVKIR